MERYQQWATEQEDVILHPALEWQRSTDDTDWSLQLRHSVPHGTCLLEIPYRLVWRANECPPIPDAALQVLASHGFYDNDEYDTESTTSNDQQQHMDTFRLLNRLLHEKDTAASSWQPWLDALPIPNTLFTDEDINAMPLHAKTMAIQLRHRIKVFVKAATAAAAAAENSSDTDATMTAAAAALVYSRAWNAGDCTTMEMVPIADMFNHHDDPANVRAVHDDTARVVRFLFCGQNSVQRLGLSYGSPAYVHRFLVVFGFVDTTMRRVAAHLLLPPLPSGMTLDDLVVYTKDGRIDPAVRYLILHQLLVAGQRDEQAASFRQAVAERDEEQLEAFSKRLRVPVDQVLRNHITSLVHELQSLRPAAVQCPNCEIILSHNVFLTQVYQRVLDRLEQEMVV